MVIIGQNVLTAVEVDFSQQVAEACIIWKPCRALLQIGERFFQVKRHGAVKCVELAKAVIRVIIFVRQRTFIHLNGFCQSAFIAVFISDNTFVSTDS